MLDTMRWRPFPGDFKCPVAPCAWSDLDGVDNPTFPPRATQEESDSDYLRWLAGAQLALSRHVLTHDPKPSAVAGDVEKVPYPERLAAIEAKYQAFGFNGPTPADRERDHAIGYLLDMVDNRDQQIETGRRASQPGTLRSPDDLPDEPPLFTTRQLFKALEGRVKLLEDAQAANWPHGRRMPTCIAGSAAWYHTQAVREHRAEYGMTSTLPTLYTIAEANQAVDWWNKRAAELASEPEAPKVDGPGCPHAHLDAQETPHGPRGWKCDACGESGPTVLSVLVGSVAPTGAAIRGTCVCGEGWQWPPQETGIAVQRWLSEHANCKAGAPGLITEVVTSEPNAALYFHCPSGHPRACRTTTTTEGGEFRAGRHEVVCPQCEQAGTTGLLRIGEGGADAAPSTEGAPPKPTPLEVARVVAQTWHDAAFPHIATNAKALGIVEVADKILLALNGETSRTRLGVLSEEWPWGTERADG